MSPSTPIPANVPIPVIFARDMNAAVSAQVPRPAVAVVPQPSTFNNFGNLFYARMLVLPPQPTLTVQQFSMSVMFAGEFNTSAFFERLLANYAWVLSSSVPPLYVGILGEAGSYGEIVQLLGFERAVTALRQLGDAVVLRLEGSDTERLKLIDSDDFHLGALRSSSAYVAFRHGSRYLRPQPLNKALDSASSFHISARLPSANNSYEIDFDFQPDELHRDRVAVLIGRNGTGKTQLMLKLIEAQQPGHHQQDEVPAFISPPAMFNRLLMFSSVASDTYPRSIPPWSGVDYQYFSMIGGTDAEDDALTGALIDCLRDHTQFHFPTIERPFGTTNRLSLLQRALESLSMSEHIHLPLKEQPDPHDLPDTRVWNGRQYFPLFRSLNEQRNLLLVRKVDWSRSPVAFGLGTAPRTLSSGELAMLRFAAQAAGSIETGCLLLFDEPETHLHPNFVSEFMTILHTLLAITRSVAIIVTHSAYVVREVPRQRVRILSVNDRIVSVDQPRLQTFGASIDGISQFIFGDSNISHRYEEVLENWLNQLGHGVTIERVIQDHGERLNPETLSYIAHLLRTRLQ
ncbi:AAA family ATPase [Bradyrhizobium japonicum]|uniref:AAA family ATPase n=1 Tax=Bradyrhizobium japonicum TaxID=375 RepID=UPI001BA8EC40|nr:AAA family ATPase [Bradyrhizobium japonicum]MBR0731581.1 AAA family ATPase [Bradyrhizobium japonicum]